MKTVVYNVARNGSSKLVHLVCYDNDPNVKSMASMVLLTEWLSERDEDEASKRQEIQHYLNRRHKFLLREKMKHGGLRCHYCNKPNLEIGYRSFFMSYKNNKNPRLATIDHKVPVSSGTIDKLDEVNWVVSCRKCNGEKGSMPYEEFLKSKRLEQRKKQYANKKKIKTQPYHEKL